MSVEADNLEIVRAYFAALGESPDSVARFAQFFRLKDGKIVGQRNYDCFYPW